MAEVSRSFVYAYSQHYCSAFMYTSCLVGTMATGSSFMSLQELAVMPAFMVIRH